MKHGYLSQYFKGVAIKRLSAVEADTNCSNQHEFNGVEALKEMLGEPTGKVRFNAKFLYLSDQDAEPITDESFLTWYDAREKARNERAVMRWEYRLYFPGNRVSTCAAEGDLLVIAKPQKPDDTLLAIIVEQQTTIESQIRWLFGFSDIRHPGFSVKSELETDQDRIGFAARTILEMIGVCTDDTTATTTLLDEMLANFSGKFPVSNIFSSYAREKVTGINDIEDPDSALVAWMEKEEILFRTLEKHLLAENLDHLCESKKVDPEYYIKLVQSALQRRKSRAGNALENHLEQIFKDNNILFSRNPFTEGRKSPDFLFPNESAYKDIMFPQENLTMLAAKSTCKDRWRQILNEAERIPLKHLLTLEPSISEPQTAEMLNSQVQLVLPRTLHVTYTKAQQGRIIDLRSFIELVKERQALI